MSPLDGRRRTRGTSAGGSGAISARSAPELRRLRRRLTAIYTVASAIGLIVLAGVTSVVEARLSGERRDEELIGWASRAASLVDDSSGRLDSAGIDDDVLDDRVAWVVYDTTPDGSLRAVGGNTGMDGTVALAELALLDDEEQGTVGEVTIDRASRRAAAMPAYLGDAARGAVVVAELDGHGDPRLARAVWIAAAALVAFGAVAGWWFAGRSIRPAIAALDHHEQFLAAAAHELRMPLARVRAVGESASLLVADPGGPATDDDLRHELARLRTLTADASISVERLLLIARVDAGRVTLRRELLELGPLVHALTADHPTVRVDVPVGVVVDADPALLRLALANLIANAERHGATAGRPPRIVVAATRTAGVTALEVSDDGPGIPVDITPELFERFRSGAPGGSGVGLWLVRWIAERHGGTVAARNQVGGPGATFTLLMPDR